MNVNWNADYRSKGLSGLMSGIDTDSMVEKLLQGTQKKIDKQNSAKQQLQWKQTQYQSVIKNINTLKDKYFNSSFDADTSNNLLSSKFFNSMQSSLISGDGVRVLSSDSSARVGEMRISVSQLASAAKLSSNIKMSGTQSITGGVMDIDSIEIALSSGKELSFDLTLDGLTKNITFSKEDFSDGYTAANIKTVLDSKLSRAFGDYVKADVEGGKLSFSINIEDSNGNPEAGHELKITGADAAVFGVEPGASTVFRLSTKLGSLSSLSEGESYKFSINGESFELDADASVNSLISKVNSSDAGVKLSYSSLTDSFSLEATSTGAQYGINVSQETGNILSALFGTGIDSANVYGTDAKLTINGVETSRSSNTFSFEGLTLTAAKVSTEETVIGTERDTDKIVGTIKSFVEDYNKVVEDLYGHITEDAKYKQFPPLTSAQKKEMSEDEIKQWTEKAKTGLLRNDPNISSFLSSMRSAFYTKVESAGIAAYSIGIETTEGSLAGRLTLDETALRNAIASDPDAVERLFTDSEGGLATKLNQTCENYAKLSMANPGSLVRLAGAEGYTAYSKQNDMYLELGRINDRLSDLQNRYEKERQKYWDKFNAMESIIAQYSAQGSMISSSFYGGGSSN